MDMTISIKMDYCRVSYLVRGDGQLFHILSKTSPIPHEEKGDRTGPNPNPILASSLNVGRMEMWGRGIPSLYI
ncbi:unnamed protein product [Prunus brigantina]